MGERRAERGKKIEKGREKERGYGRE